MCVLLTPLSVCAELHGEGIIPLPQPQVGDNSVTVGACVTLTQLITFLRANVDKSASFKDLSDHLLRIANVAVRNVSCMTLIVIQHDCMLNLMHLQTHGLPGYCPVYVHYVLMCTY